MTDPEPTAEQPLVTVEQLERVLPTLCSRPLPSPQLREVGLGEAFPPPTRRSAASHLCSRPSLRPHYRALTATTGRSAPVPRIGTLALAVSAACGSPSRGQKPWPSLSGRQVLLFHASACDELTPPIHRAPPGPHTGSSPTEDPPQRAFVPRPPTDPSFDAIVVSFRCVSSGSHTFVFSSHTRPATARRHPQRSPPRLLTDAACGGLESPPARRPRRTYPHHWHSTDRADDLLHHHHFPSGHTWVPETLPWSLACRDAGRC